MLKKFDRVCWLGDDLYIKANKFLSNSEVVTVTEISPCGELCWVQVANGSEYGWLKINKLALVSPMIVPLFNSTTQACA